MATDYCWIHRVLAATVFGLVAAGAHAQTIFACEPEWAALTRALLPEARLLVATQSAQDPHYIEARPALIAQLRSADAAICTGASLESGWLPVLQQRSGNPRVQSGASGLFFAANAVKLMDARPGAGGSPFAGDVHEEGNPHFHVDPDRLLEVARVWGRQLQQLFPAQAPAIDARFKMFQADWQQRMPIWKKRAEALRGRQVVAQHASFAYLWSWVGMQQVADLEPQPGLAPTPGHLRRLLQQLVSRPPSLIVVGSYQDDRSARWLAHQLGGRVPVVILPATVEDPESPDALGRWFDRLLTALEAH